MDFRLARDRRRFFIERAQRRRGNVPCATADVQSLMDLPRTELRLNPKALFGEMEVCVVGGVATRAYMPERTTKDVDFLICAEDFDEAEQRLRDAGYAASTRDDALFFPNSMLGLFGRAWRKDNERIDLISSRQPWVRKALEIQAFDQTGLRVIALPYLVLMKIDASRGQDQADIERMLGRLSDADVDEVAAIVDRYSGDPQAAEDVRQYAQLGRLEYGRFRDSE